MSELERAFIDALGPGCSYQGLKPKVCEQRELAGASVPPSSH